jgi:hypothetical protein
MQWSASFGGIMGHNRLAAVVLASGLVGAIVASAATAALLKSGMTSGATRARDMAEIEKLHKRPRRRELRGVRM